VLTRPVGLIDLRYGLDGAVISTGRFVTPVGVEVGVGAPKAYGMALSPDRETLATINGGVSPFTPAPSTAPINVNATFMGIVYGHRFLVG
jgi:hypothetical protein